MINQPLQDLNHLQGHLHPPQTLGFEQTMGSSQSSSPGNLDQREEEESVDSSFTCEICIEPVVSNKKFKYRQKRSCTHPYCVDCISKYIEVKVDDNVSEIKCPDPNCDEFFESVLCQSILPVRVFEKWCDVLCNAAVLRWERTYCPYRDCSALILNECGEKIKKSKCPSCKKLFCFKCNVPWHSGYQCHESREMRDTNDVLFGTLAERNKWRRCPSCNHFVELRSGCLAVRCSSGRGRAAASLCSRVLMEAAGGGDMMIVLGHGFGIV
ncbi:hypothetical protein GIB67_008241 [Kingdonia uniflora]|uniref:RBR-type E3 ubiquitin transferase n=1 Tax=Kingdonia uniflora TaxID=39325 RepID=A0A7J7N500_9MAGN|nr:hypothetical protein GIB67_008241 [Kingdonia uniflora]